MTGQDDHNGIRMETLDLLREMEAVFSGQPDVHEDETGVKNPNLLKGFLTLGGLGDVQRWKLIQQQFFEGEPKGGIVFDDEHRKHDGPFDELTLHFTIDGDYGK